MKFKSNMNIKSEIERERYESMINILDIFKKLK